MLTHDVKTSLINEGFELQEPKTLPPMVLTIVIDESRPLAVGLLKNKGPSFLIGKITFPGGHVEGDESASEAASREFFEETGLKVPASDFRFVAANDRITVLTATHHETHKARTCEDEEVMVFAIDRQLEYAVRNPELYAPGFSALLLGALDINNFE